MIFSNSSEAFDMEAFSLKAFSQEAFSQEAFNLEALHLEVSGMLPVDCYEARTIMKRIEEFFQAVRREKNGYLTIELSMVFSVLFFSLLLILFIGMVLYQEVHLQSLAVQASERGSVVYSSRVSDMTTNIKSLEDFKIRDPYRNVPFMDGGKKGEYTSLVNRYVADRIGSRNIISGENHNGGNYTEIEDYLIAKRVKVTISAGYRMPGGDIPSMFGHEGPFDVNTAAVSAVVDAPDFVRNIDIITDIASQTKAFATIQGGYNKIKEAIQKVADLLK